VTPGDPQLEEAPPVGCFFLNSAVITGAEPIVIDTGTPVKPHPVARGPRLDRRPCRCAVDLHLT